MEAIIKYRANDGSEWNTAEDAERRDALIGEVESAMAMLRPIPNTTDFMNGHGYVQQKAESLRIVKQRLFRIANRQGILKWWIDSQKKDHGKTDHDFIHNIHASWFGRMLDGGHRPLERAYSRLQCIDEQNREWGQPYYANNPDKGDQVEVSWGFTNVV